MDWNLLIVIVSFVIAGLGFSVAFANLPGVFKSRSSEIRVQKSAEELRSMVQEFEDERTRYEGLLQLRESGGQMPGRAPSPIPAELVAKVDALSVEAGEAIRGPRWRRFGTAAPTAAALVATLVAALTWVGWTPVFPNERQCLEYTDSVRDTYVALGKSTDATAHFYESAGLSSYRGECGQPSEMLPPQGQG